MPTFTNYAFYTEHGGRLSEADYNASVFDAYTEILSQTNEKALTAPDSMAFPIKLCESALVGVIHAYKALTDMLPRGATSASNDGLSVSTGSGNASPFKTEAQERRAVCTRYLQWPVNLMDRWL